METDELEVSGITKMFRHRSVLSDVYMKCRTSEVTGILGRNGSGKSTLLQIIFGTVPADEKRVLINGKMISKPDVGGKSLAYLPQNGFLPNYIRVKNIVKIFIADKARRQKIMDDEVVSRHLNNPITALSGGERRSLEVLLIINLPVKFVLLDEPFSGIEPLYKEKIGTLIQAGKKEKGFLITDHDYRCIINNSSQLYLLDQGVLRKIHNHETELEAFNYVPKGTFTGGKATPAKHIPFDTDRQTLKDLDMVENFHEGGLFRLFDISGTPGARQKLAEIFKSPLRDIQALEARRDAIKYIHEQGINPSIEKKQIVAIEYYLDSNIGLFNRNPFISIVQRLKYYFSPSSEYYTVETGIRNIIRFLKHMESLVPKLHAVGTTLYLTELSYKIQDTLGQDGIREVLDKEESFSLIGKMDHLFRKSPHLKILLNIYYELDVLEAIGKTANHHGFTYPVYLRSEEATVQIQGLFHPLVKEAVPNNFSLQSNNSLCFLTGANMSGKSTFLKSFGIAVYLAHLGFPVPAAAMNTTVFHGLRTTINLSDNITLGYSHFYSEVMRIKEIAYSIRKNQKMIVVLDELFKGTNVKDAAEVSLMVTKALSKVPQSLFIVSTHHVEISEKLKDLPNICFKHFAYQVENDMPAYTYKILDGVSNDRAGLLILKKEGIMELLSLAASSHNPQT